MANDSLRKNPACSIPTTAESSLCETTQVSWQYLSYVHNMTSSLRIKSFFTMLLDCLTIKCNLGIECLHVCVQLLHLCRKIGTVPYEHFHPR